MAEGCICGLGSVFSLTGFVFCLDMQEGQTQVSYASCISVMQNFLIPGWLVREIRPLLCLFPSTLQL